MPSPGLVLERVQAALQEFGLEISSRPDGADTLVCIRVPPETGVGGEESPSELSEPVGSSFHEGSSTDTPSVVAGAGGDSEEAWWLRVVPLEPFFTWSLGTHQGAVRPPPGDFDISHGFASQADSRAFCLGAGLLDLPAEL